MKKLLNLTSLSLCLLIFVDSNATEVNIELEEMKPIIEKYNQGLAKNPNELFEHSLSLSLTLTPSLQSGINKFLGENQIIIEAFSKKYDSIDVATQNIDSLLESNATLTTNLNISGENCRMNLELDNKQYNIIFSTPALRAANIVEKHGLWGKPMSEEQENAINADFAKLDTFQHISRASEFELFEKIKKDKNLSLVYTPTVYLLKVPWNSENRIADDTCIILEEQIANLQLVDETFTSTMNYEQVRQIYEITKGAGIWNLSGNWYRDNEGKMYILNLQQQSKTSPDNFMNPIDPLLNRREAIKQLSSYFPFESDQFKFLIRAIMNDLELYNEDNSAKKFMKTLLNKANEAQLIQE